MLVFWDIHINHRYQHDIIDEITNYIAQCPDEEHLLFLWDYVYHFAYDREALLALYQLWISLFKQGKKLYILAGNHDRIGKSFVYQEAQRAFEIISDFWGNGAIHFITEPLQKQIEGQDMLFFPFSLEYTTTNLLQDQWKKRTPIEQNIIEEITQLKNKKHKNFQISAEVNTLLLEKINAYQGDDLLVVHHHYIDGVKFPWEKAQFSFKNIALSKQFLQMPQCRFLSGHLHQNFVYQNYLCVGSIRNTSSLETNQIKGAYRYTDKQRYFSPLWINPNFSYLLQKNQTVDANILGQLLTTMWTDLAQQLGKDQQFGKIHLQKNEDIPLHKTQITITTDKIAYEHIDDYITADLRTQLKDVKLKKTKLQSLDMQQLATLYDKKQMNTFSDWKNLLKDFLKNSYPAEYSQYEDFLVKHKIL